MSDADSDTSTVVSLPPEKPEPTPEQLAKSEEIKAQANKKFQESHLKEAIDLYTEAIELNQRNHVLYANRAFCHVKLENYGSAIIDATEAITLDPTYIKGYYRRGTAYLALHKLKQARADFREAVKIEPANKDARSKLNECEKAIRKEKFEAAIGVDHGAPATQIDPDTIEVESTYTGPRLEDGIVTEKFMDELLLWLKAEKKLHKKYVYQILYQVRNILKQEKTVVDVPVVAGESITVCGDVHGQYYDLLNIFEMNGKPSKANPYLFNGDFVDRGSFGLEVVLALFGYKCLLPNHMHLNRGNHESVNMNKIYGFEGEVASKYSTDMMALFTDIFQWLPLGHVIENKVLVVHGGLFSKDETTLEEVRKISRHCEPPDEGPMTEMLWSDPGSLPGRQPSKRGVGVSFGADVTERFLSANGLELLIRSHECKDDGYEMEHNGKTITVFSAPNYCDQMGNKGAYIRLDKDLKPNISTFTAVPHPQIRPMQYSGYGGFNFMNFL